MPFKLDPSILEGKSCSEYRITPSALSKWDPSIQAKAADNTISIYDVIGADFWSGEGMTVKKMAGILRTFNNDDVIVNINSPGGDMFEGLAIYNLLREYTGRVTVNIVGIAASAASVIAMAGDEIRIAKSAFLMIHNCSVIVNGNRNTLSEVAEQLKKFDKAMAGIYMDKTGKSSDEILAMMDEEAYINGTTAIEQGFADSYITSDEIEQTDLKTKSMIKQLDTLLARSGMTRHDRRELFNQIKGTHNAANSDTQNAVISALAEIQHSINKLNGEQYNVRSIRYD